ncbi:reverse transcriptase domain-containing protein [Tanacetum coccineum]
MARSRRGNRASMQVVFIPKAKSGSASDIPGHWSPHVSVSRQALGQPFVTSLTRYYTPVSTEGALRAFKSNRSKNLLQQIGAIRETLFPNYLEFRMTGPTPDPTTPYQSPSLRDQIMNHVSSLEALIKQHNEKSGTLITPIRLTFREEVDSNKGKDKEKGVAEGVDDDLKKPYKEVLKSAFTRRIIEFSALSHRMPTNLRIYHGSTDPDDHISCFVGAANQGEWEMPRFVERFVLRRRCSKDPTEVSKIIRRANEMLPKFKEHWTEEMGYIQGVPEVMQILAFMSNSKCLELARRFTDQVPQTGEQSERRHGTPYKGFRPSQTMQSGGPPKADGYNAYNRRDHYQPYVPPRQPGQRYGNWRFKNQRQEVNQLSLESLVKRPKKILATELQLLLPPPPLLVGKPKRENLDRYCDYHGENEHYTNDCFQLKRQLEIALESGKLNHLVKDVRQRGGNWGKQVGNSSNNGKIINMLYETRDDQKRKFQKRREEDWMNALITFPPIPSDDVSDEPLIIEAKVEGYLVRRVFVDQGATMQVMFEHCFRNLCPTIQASLTQTHTYLVGFSGEQLLPIGKIELEVMFGSEGLSRRTMMKFKVVQASSPHNIILGRTGLRELYAISSTTHAMMKFPTPSGIATLVPRRDAIFESKNYHCNTVLFGLSSPIDKFVKRQQGLVRLATIGHGRHPKMNKSAFFKRESEYHVGSTKTKGLEPGEEQGCNERS